MRKIYTFLLFLSLPFIFLRLLWKSRREKTYRKRLLERLGCYPFKLEECIWVHAVSMGEVIAATPLIKKIKERYPSIPLLVTTMTPTGANQVAKTLQDVAIHAYLPYDFPPFLACFLKTMRPRVALIMETELWPNTIAACKAKAIPICLLNARLSESSAQGYQRIASLVKPMLQSISAMAVHGEKDAERFVALGARKENMMVTGSIKFDLELPSDLPHKVNELRQLLRSDRFIWVAGSTHEGEEEIILSTHNKLCQVVPNALLILVPRHSSRFDAVAKLSEKSFTTARRSHSGLIENAQVYLGDTMGEMLLLYGAGDVAFVGGSLIERGGHNLLEPAALQKPVLSGPSLYNFSEISDMLRVANALLVVDGIDSLVEQLVQLVNNEDYRYQLGLGARQVVEANRGALAKQLTMVEKFV